MCGLNTGRKTYHHRIRCTVMVDTSLVVAVIGVGGTLIASAIGAYVNLQTSKLSERNENHRTIADYYMEEKVNTLLDFHKANVDLSSGFVKYVFLERDESEDFELTEEHIDLMYDQLDRWTELFERSKVFLDGEQEQVVRRASIVYWSIYNQIELDNDGYHIDWDEVENDEIIDQMKAELDRLRKHARLVREMLDSEINQPIKDIYGSPDVDTPFEKDFEWRKEMRSKYQEIHQERIE